MTTATTTRVATLAELRKYEGKPLGTSSWIEVLQERISIFADATEDHQWIHVGPERTKVESPFGGPIAHGYLTLSLIIPMWHEVLKGRQRDDGRQLRTQPGPLHRPGAGRWPSPVERDPELDRGLSQG